MLRAYKSSGAGTEGEHSGLDEVSNAIEVEEDNEEAWDFDGVMNAAEADGRSIRGKFHEIQTECQVMHTEVRAGLVDRVKMAKRNVTIEMQVNEIDRELQKTEHVSQVARGAILEAHYLALSSSEVAHCSCQYVHVWKSRRIRP